MIKYQTELTKYVIKNINKADNKNATTVNIIYLFLSYLVNIKPGSTRFSVNVKAFSENDFK